MTIACNAQKDGVMILIEVILHQGGEPFRRDAMKKPVVVTGIDPSGFHGFWDVIETTPKFSFVRYSELQNILG